MRLGTPALRLASGLRLAARPGVFRADDLIGLPPAATRYFRASIEPGARHTVAAALSMRGELRLGARWLPFRAHEVLAPQDGFVWAARVAGLVGGADSFVGGRGRTRFSLAGTFPLVRAEGPDVDRSAAGRSAAEAVWVPTSLLPGCGVTLEGLGERAFVARFLVAGEPQELTIETLSSGHLAGARLHRWGDPDGTGEWALHPFGLEVTGYGTWEGVTFPAAGRVGWFAGSSRFEAGEFFRFRLTRYLPIGHDPAEAGVASGPDTASGSIRDRVGRFVKQPWTRVRRIA